MRAASRSQHPLLRSLRVYPILCLIFLLCIIALVVSLSGNYFHQRDDIAIVDLVKVTEGAPPSRPHAGIAASIFIGQEGHLIPRTSNGSTVCTDFLDRLTAFDIYEVQFLPTFYWMDKGPLYGTPDNFDPTCQTNYYGTYCHTRWNTTELDYWCYDRKNGRCREPTLEEIEMYVERLSSCMQHAVKLGFDISVNARIDDGRQLGGWRNTIRFDPLIKYGNYSYLEAILYPLADAMKRAAGPDTRLSFTMQGEMGATISTYPTSWIKVLKLLKQRLKDVPGEGQEDRITIGLGINSNKLCGCIEDMESWTEEDVEKKLYLAFERIKPMLDVPGYRKLLASVDFISISAYIDVWLPDPFDYDACYLELLTDRVNYELGLWGINLTDLARDYGTVVYFGEFSLGGGLSPNANVPAKTAEEAAARPYNGITGPYDCSIDPFDMCHPEAPNEVREYRRHYFGSAIDLLDRGGCRQKIQHLALWTLGSWDVLGVAPIFAEGNGSFADPVIISMINHHNKKTFGRPRRAWSDE